MGGKGGGSISFPNIPHIPSLDVGTNFVAADGLAYLHQGEAVVPKEYNPAVGGGNIDYDKLGMTMAKYLKFDFNVDGEKLTESVNTHNAVDNRINKF